MLSKHCLECHDSIAEAGDLDLSRRSATLRGGESGPALVPGDPDASLLWDMIELDSMPPESHPRMTDAEKEVLREWIVREAPWAAKVIDPAEFSLDDSPPPMWLRRLTVPQYIRSVHALTGVDIAAEAAKTLPPEQRADGFANTAYNLEVDLTHVEGFAQLSEVVVERMNVTAFLLRHTRCQSLTDDCIDPTIESVATQFFRGRPQGHELASLRKLFDAAVDEGADFQDAIAFVVQGLLQSPRFLFLIEDAAAGQEPERVTDLELASRLSYAAWGQSPDRELLRAALAGELSDTQRLKAQVERLLRNERAINHSMEFVENWLDLGRLGYLRPQPTKFPDWDAALADDMRAETEAFFREVAWNRNRPLSDLFNAQVTFLTPRLAQHYNIPWDFAAEFSDPQAMSAASDMLAFFTFDKASDATVLDLAGGADPLNLKPNYGDRVAWTSDGLKLESSVRVTSSNPAESVNRAIKKTGELTIEMWVRPKSRGQKGPAFIVGIPGGRHDGTPNFIVGQEGDRYVVEYRSTSGDKDGKQEIKAAHGSVELRWTHLAFTVDRSGTAKLFINGEEQKREDFGGDFSNWDDSFALMLGNDTRGNVPWLGTFRRLGIYQRALSAEEIRQLNEGPVRHELTNHPERGGLLTQAGILTVGGDEASMVARGLFVLRDLLYSRVGNPPPCVDSEPKPSKPGMTQRDLAMVRLSDGSCTGCHSKFEPLAFGLEKFDGVGAHHEADEHGNQLRDDGEILFPGQDEPVTYENSAELMDILAASERVQKGVTRKLIQFAIARPLVAADAASVDQIHNRGRENGGTYAALMAEVLTSDLVLHKYPELAE